MENDNSLIMSANKAKLSSHLTRISVKGFKSIREAEVELKPLTVLLGSNSAGKSSIIQALLLLCSNYKSDGRMQINLNNGIVNLGSSDEIRHNSAFGPAVRLEGSSYVELKKVKSPSLQIKVDVWLPERFGSGSRTTFEMLGKFVTKKGVKGSIPVDKVLVTETLENVPKTLTITKVSEANDPEGTEKTAVRISGKYHFRGNRFNLRRGLTKRPGLEDMSARGGKDNVREIDGITRQVPENGYFPTPDQSPVYLKAPVWKSVVEYFVISLYLNIQRESRVSSKREFEPNHLVELGHSMFLSSKNDGVHPEFIEIVSDFDSQLKNAAFNTLEELDIEKLISKVPKFSNSEITSMIENFVSTLKANVPMEKLMAQKYVILPISQSKIRNEYESALDLERSLRGVLTSKIHYLGPLRALALDEQKSNPVISNLCPVGPRGEYLAWSLSSIESQEIRNYPVPTSGDTFSIRKLDLESAVSLWLTWFDIGSSLSFDDQGGWGKFLEVDSEKLNQKGTGVSQVLPVLALCLMAKEGSTSIIEQPELHLHPKLQQKLGTFFAVIVNSGRRLVIETHSEYLLTRIRKEVAVSNFSNEDLSLIFVSKKRIDKDGWAAAEYEAVDVSPAGTVSRWPQEYFDFTSQDKMDIFEAAFREPNEN
jgi:predicted ATPase